MPPKKKKKGEGESGGAGGEEVAVAAAAAPPRPPPSPPPLLVGLEGDGEILRDTICAFLNRDDIVALMDADLQDDPAALPQMVAKWQEGYEVVYAVRFGRKENIVKRSLFHVFYRLLNAISSTPLPNDAGNFGIGAALVDPADGSVKPKQPICSPWARALSSTCW